MISYSNYPKIPDLRKFGILFSEYTRLKHETGVDGSRLSDYVKKLEMTLDDLLDELKSLPENKEFAALEPDELDQIQSLRPVISYDLWTSFDKALYENKLKGALMGRFSGCTLGAIVEFWSIDEMKAWAEYTGDPFPPIDYWSQARDPAGLRYRTSPCSAYTKQSLRKVPVDDDITYTILNLLIFEKYGKDFSVGDVGKAWIEYLPYACTAEDVALNNLKQGVDAKKAADINNPFSQWIGADIRADPWGYLAPGLPGKASEYAWRDAFISHRRNGIYGAMFFAAAISAAFAVDNVYDAFWHGLNQIPKDCLLAGDIRWAIDISDTIKDYSDARKAVDDRFGDMSRVHTNINACLSIFGLTIGGEDFTKVIGQTVAMGYDNDCTAATAGSLFGALHGIDKIPSFWYENFNNKVLTYINGHPDFNIDDLINRFTKGARTHFAS